jgi:hypothetical protein
VQEPGKDSLFLPSRSGMAFFTTLNGDDIIDLGETESDVWECHPILDWTAIKTKLDGLVPESRAHLQTLFD